MTPRVRTFRLAPGEAHQLSSVTSLQGANHILSSIAFLPEHDLLVTGDSDGALRVYGLNTDGKPERVLLKHLDFVTGLVQLDGDLVASAGFSDRQILAWRASTGQVIGKWRHESRLTGIAKLNQSQIIVGDENGNLDLLLRNQGTSFQIGKRLYQKAHSSAIKKIVVHSNIISTCSVDRKTAIWDTYSQNCLAQMKHRFPASNIDI